MPFKHIRAVGFVPSLIAIFSGTIFVLAIHFTALDLVAPECPVHPASAVILDNYLQGRLTPEQFQRLFSLPRSCLLHLGEFIVEATKQP